MSKEQSKDETLLQLAEAVRSQGVIDRANDYIHIDFKGSDQTLRETLRAFVDNNPNFSLGASAGGFALPCLSCQNDTLSDFPTLQEAIQDALRAGRTLEDTWKQGMSKQR